MKKWMHYLILSALCLFPAMFSGCETKDKPAKHVILISMDTTRADHLSCYGFDKKTTPNIDKFAKDSVLFEQCISPIPYTLPAHSSMITGTNPVYHGVHENIDYVLAPENTTLAERFTEIGYKTGGIISTYVLDHRFGMNQGFDDYNDTFGDSPKDEKSEFKAEESELKLGKWLDEHSYAERIGDEGTQLACQWLEKNKNENFFLFLHYYDPHSPFEPPEPFATDFKDDLYAGEIAFTDYCIKQVLDKLKELKIYKDSLIIIVGDHGEGLGDHGELEHGYYVYQSCIHVPMIVHFPGSKYKNKRIDQTVGLVDLAPTICRWTGMDSLQEYVGQDLTNYVEEKRIEGRLLYSESLMPTRYSCSSLLSLTGDRWKYIQSSAPELYDLKSDPSELTNLIESESKRARVFRDELKLLLTEQVRSTTSRTDQIMDEESRAKLESLGYVASGTLKEDFEFDTDKAVPADWLKTYQMINSYKFCFRNEQYDRAEMFSLKIMEDKPYYVENYYFLAQTQYELGKYAEAASTGLEFIARAEKKIDGDSEDKTLIPVQNFLNGCRDLVGRAYFQRKEYKKALAQFHQALETLTEPDQSAKIYNNMGNAYRLQGHLKQALEHFKKAIESDPSLSPAYSNMGQVYVRMGEYENALELFEKAEHLDSGTDGSETNYKQKMKMIRAIQGYLSELEKTPKNSNLLDQLATSYIYLGATDKAAEYWQKALEISPDHVDILNNLAFIYVQKSDVQNYDPDRALGYAQKANDLTKYQNPNFLDTLALIHAGRGDFTQAIDIAQQALTLAYSTNQPTLAESIQKSIEQYKKQTLP